MICVPKYFQNFERTSNTTIFPPPTHTTIILHLMSHNHHLPQRGEVRPWASPSCSESLALHLPQISVAHGTHSATCPAKNHAAAARTLAGRRMASRRILRASLYSSVRARRTARAARAAARTRRSSSCCPLGRSRAQRLDLGLAPTPRSRPADRTNASRCLNGHGRCSNWRHGASATKINRGKQRHSYDHTASRRRARRPNRSASPVLQRSEGY
eukprot:SAG31_NODE_1113_length_9854_cov_2.770682_7_plen_214_part_00